MEFQESASQKNNEIPSSNTLINQLPETSDANTMVSSSVETPTALTPTALTPTTLTPTALKPKGRRVKRVIHCSDGVYEEFSSDEDGVYQLNSPVVDPKTMTWMPWIGHMSSKALAACDYVGESLADFLGITTPKYSYEIAEAERMKAQQEAEKKEADLEMAGWARSPLASSASVGGTTDVLPQTSTPSSIMSVHYETKSTN